MTTKLIATALLAAGMAFGSTSVAEAGCSYGYGEQSKPAKQSTPTST